MSNSYFILLSEALKQFEGKTPSCAFIAMNSRGENNHVWTEHLFDDGDRDRSCLIDNEKLSLGQLCIVLWLDVLNSLTMILEDVDPNDCVIEIRVGRL